MLEAHRTRRAARCARPRSPRPGYLSDLFSAFYPLGAASPVLRRSAWRARPGAGGTRRTVLAHLLPGRPGRGPAPGRRPHRGLAGARSRRATAALAGRVRRVARRRPRPGRGAVHARSRRSAPGRGCCAGAGVGGALRLGPAVPAAGAGARRGAVPRRGRAAAARRLALHTDLAPDDAGSGVFGWLLAMLGQQYGFPVPVGGAGRLTDALVGRLRARGGAVACGGAGRPGPRRAAAGRSVCGSPTARWCGPAGRSSPTCRRRRSTGTWSAPSICRRGSGGPAQRFRWDDATRQGRLGAVRAGAVDARRHAPAPARCTSAPTSTA